MRTAQGFAALALLVVGGLLGSASDANRSTPRPPPGPASLLGGFSALAVQVLWIRADNALSEGDTAEALLQLDLIAELEPQLVRGAAFIAHEVGYNLSGDAVTPEQRWGLAREGLRILTRSVRNNPGIAEALTVRADFLLLRLYSREFASPYEAESGRTPVAAALDDYRASARLDPGDVETLDGLALAGMYHGLELCRAKRFDDAGEAFDVARASFVESARLYREGGLAETTAEGWALPFTEALLDAVTAPEAEREERVKTAFDLFVGAIDESRRPWGLRPLGWD